MRANVNGSIDIAPVHDEIHDSSLSPVETVIVELPQVENKDEDSEPYASVLV